MKANFKATALNDVIRVTADKTAFKGYYEPMVEDRLFLYRDSNNVHACASISRGSSAMALAREDVGFNPERIEEALVVECQLPLVSAVKDAAKRGGDVHIETWEGEKTGLWLWASGSPEMRLATIEARTDIPLGVFKKLRGGGKFENGLTYIPTLQAGIWKFISNLTKAKDDDPAVSIAQAPGADTGCFVVRPEWQKGRFVMFVMGLQIWEDDKLCTIAGQPV